MHTINVPNSTYSACVITLRLTTHPWKKHVLGCVREQHDTSCWRWYCYWRGNALKKMLMLWVLVLFASIQENAGVSIVTGTLKLKGVITVIAVGAIDTVCYKYIAKMLSMLSLLVRLAMCVTTRYMPNSYCSLFGELAYDQRWPQTSIFK